MDKKSKDIWKAFFKEKIIAKDFTKKEIWKTTYKDKININAWDIITFDRSTKNIGPSNSIIVNIQTKRKVRPRAEFHIGWYIYKIEKDYDENKYLVKIVRKATFDESTAKKVLQIVKGENRQIGNSIDTNALKTEIISALKKELAFLRNEDKTKEKIEEVERFNEDTTAIWIDMTPKNKWERLYGKAMIVYDFAGYKIEKDEFKSNTHFSWDVLFYNVDRPEKGFLIANQQTIIKMNGQNEFWIDEILYKIILRDGKYSIKSNTKIINLTDPFQLQKEINYHLFSFNKDNVLLNQEFFSLLIEFPVFPRILAENIQHLINKFFKVTSLFKASYIYIMNTEENSEMVNLQLRYYFKYHNNNSYGIAFDLTVILRSYLSLVRENLKMHNLLGNQNIGFYSLYLDQKILGLKYINWYTHDKINLINSFPKPKHTYDRELVVNPNIYYLLKQQFDQYDGFESFKIKNKRYFQYNNYLNNIEDYIKDVFKKKDKNK